MNSIGYWRPAAVAAAIVLIMALSVAAEAQAQRGGGGRRGGGPTGVSSANACTFSGCFDRCLRLGGCDGSNILARCCSRMCSNRCSGQSNQTEGRH